MNIIARIVSIFAIPKDNPDLVKAQIATFSKQIPIMYTMVILNTFTLAEVHVGHAPTWLTIVFPGTLITLSLIRMLQHWQAGRIDLSAHLARKKLKQTIILAGVLGGLFAAWALMLFPYGTPYTQAQVAVFGSVTCLGIMVCLMHLFSSAIMVVLFAVLPISAFLVLTGHQVFLNVGINLMLVSIAVLYVLSNYSKNFIQLIDNQSALKEQASEARELSDTNERLANLDSLTGLANRRKFLSELDKSLSTHRRDKTTMAVGIFDLDGFKPVNDMYGHAAGDRLLIKVSERLALQCETAFVARLGGDEFGLIFREPLSDEQLINFCDKLCETMSVPFEMGTFTAQVAGSVGLAKFPDAADNAELLFEHADYALYYAKDNAKGSAVLFSEEHSAQIRETSGIERQLHDADLVEELSVVYQLVVDADSEQPVGVEALARWTSPVLGSVPPMAFIRNAEQAGIINQLTEILLRKTLKDVADWPDDQFISFNLSSHDIGSPQHVLNLVSIVLTSGFPPDRLTFEITETAIVQDFERAAKSLQLLKNLGAKIALDDFGTGHSSLSYVQSLPIDRIKVDRSFILDLEDNKASRAIVRTIIDLCRNLDLDCIVEGVETASQLEILKEMGCRNVQGYLFSRPAGAEETSALFENRAPYVSPVRAGRVS